MERELFILGEGRYRDDDEIAEWKAKDPLDRLAARLLAQGIADEAALEEVDTRVLTLVDAAEAAADAGEAADPTLAERVMFAGAEQ
jgi:pyruvate dehydrogenase E1 component alpha subunit